MSSISSSKSASSSKSSRKSFDSGSSKSEKIKRSSLPVTGSPKTGKNKRSSISVKSTKTLSSVSGSTKSGKNKRKSLLTTENPTTENNQSSDKDVENKKESTDLSELPKYPSVPSVKSSSSDSGSCKTGKNKRSSTSDAGSIKIEDNSFAQSEPSITSASCLSETSKLSGELKLEKNFDESIPVPSVPSNPLRPGKRQWKPSQKVRENNQTSKNRILSLGSPNVKSEESKKDLPDVQTEKKSSTTEELQECAKVNNTIFCIINVTIQKH